MFGGKTNPWRHEVLVLRGNYGECSRILPIIKSETLSAKGCLVRVIEG